MCPRVELFMHILNISHFLVIVQSYLNYAFCSNIWTALSKIFTIKIVLILYIFTIVSDIN